MLVTNSTILATIGVTSDSILVRVIHLLLVALQGIQLRQGDLEPGLEILHFCGVGLRDEGTITLNLQ